MIFAHTWEKVLSGEKTQTRRIVKPGEVIIGIGDAKWIENRNKAWKNTDNVFYTLYSTGHTYAVQPGRGKPAIWWRENAFGIEYAHKNYDIDNDFEYDEQERHTGPGKSDYEHLEGNPLELKEYGYQQARIRLTHIRREDVRDISHDDVIAEGYENAMYFFSTWLSMHDPSIQLKACRGQSWNLIVNRKLEYWDATLEHVRDLMKARPAERYQAWALTFQLVQP